MPVLSEISSFGGGINRKVSPIIARIDEARVVRNAILDEVGALQKRKGYTLVGDAVDADPVRWLYPFYKIGATTTRQLLRISGSKFYKLDESGNVWKDRTDTKTLDYNSQTADFTVGATLTGGTSGATATIIDDDDSGTTGTLTLEDVSGTFQNGETITDGSGGSATVNGTLNTATNTLKSTGIPDSATYANLTIIVNAATNVLKYDGVKLENLGGSPTNGSVIAVFKDRVYIANENTVYFSDVGDPESWQGFNNFNVGLNDGDEITALMPYFNSLLIFKKNSVWQYDVDENNDPLSLRPVAYGIGTDSWRTVWIVNGVLHFTGRKGMYQFAGRIPEKVSYRVEPFFQNITGPENFVGWEDGDVYHCFIGNLSGEKDDGTDRDNVVLNYDTVLDYFSYHDPMDVKCATTFINTDDELRQYFGDSNGKVWLLWDGYADTADGTNDVEIELEYETHIFQIGEPSIALEMDEIAWRMDHKAQSPMTLEVSVDDSDFERVGLMQKAIGKSRDIKSIFSRGMDIKFRIHEYSKLPGPKLLQLVLNGEAPQEGRVIPKKYSR